MFIYRVFFILIIVSGRQVNANHDDRLSRQNQGALIYGRAVEADGGGTGEHSWHTHRVNRNEEVRAAEKNGKFKIFMLFYFNGHVDDFFSSKKWKFRLPDPKI